MDGRFTNLGTSNPSTAIYDRLGEPDSASLLGSATMIGPWFDREGNGQGWYYSVLGGGKFDRPYTGTRVPVSWDNTLQASSRGDFAVPTLFNGNFDASFNNTSTFRNSDPMVGSTAVPGWSFRNDTGLNWEDGAASTRNLVDWKDIPTLNQQTIVVDYQKDANGIPDKTKPIYESYLQRLNINPNQSDYQPNYAIKLDSVNNTITHNRFLVPDWGVLRFDVHVPDPDSAIAAFNDNIRVYLTVDGQEIELQSSAFQGVIGGKGKTGNEFPAVDLREFDENKPLDPRKSEGVSNRIGFGKQGFQTYYLDIPNEFRGKIATLKFKTNSSKTIYLDNVAFKSQALLFGNPILKTNLQEARKDIETPLFTPGDSSTNTPPYIPFINQDPISNFSNNYLIERSQYSLSYNKDLRTPNWVGYQLNKSWLGVANNSPDFQPDPKSPFNTQDNPKSTDIADTTFYQKGHMTTASQRSRNVQDIFSTYLMSNVLAQPLYKGAGDRWTKLEEYLTRIVKNQNKELYIIAGGYGQATIPTPAPSQTPNVNVPAHVWKVVLVLDRPRQGLADVTKDTLAFAIHLDNSLQYDPSFIDPKTGNTGAYIGKDPDSDWRSSIVNIRDLENLTGYDFFSNISTDIQNAIETRSVVNTNGIPGIITKINAIDSAPLMAAADESLTVAMEVLRFDGSIWHNGLVNKVTFATDQVLGKSRVLEPRMSQNTVPKEGSDCFSEVTIGSINTLQTGSSKIGFTTVSPTQVAEIQISIPQIGISQATTQETSPSQISLLQIGSFKTNLLQIGSTQVDTTEISTFQSWNVDHIASIQTIGFQDVNPSEVSLPVIVPSQQFVSSNFPSHYPISNYLTQLQSTLPTYWRTTTPINLTFNITDLPSGQLAEATITGYNPNGTPNTATITLDHNANGLGWFIDTTPQDNSEFQQGDLGTGISTDYYIAAPNSPAHGKYDLLTTILHEMGHTLGFINGYSEFDKYVKGNKFITDTFTAVLTRDRSHLDTAFHPYDLMNTSLKPGVRKLPSALNLAMMNAINSGIGSQKSSIEGITAPLTAGALIAINNGDFSTNTIQIIDRPQYGTLNSALNPLSGGDFTYTPNPSYVGSDRCSPLLPISTKPFVNHLLFAKAMEQVLVRGQIPFPFA